MDIKPTPIPGCYEIHPRIFTDQRGSFVKTFHQDIFRQHGLETHFAEEYYSHSRQNVLRGLHFQLPPQDHVKLVYCTAGEVLDAVVDLRLGSPTYGQFATFSLSAENAIALYMPKGLAHGFYAVSEQATMLYRVSTVYSPEHDAGIRWDSAGIPWPSAVPILSSRDQTFPTLADFASPFVFSAPLEPARV
ncbi:dTDP-4-dehydrorhamnose 3,5-epimerase [Almyronema epifaneia]|uniref:dTDP-4-dehydrorhamnose 3,5-epimerase n=1 Tax=Almyronema epifaneia S1 TaxID=2991925 RepID=A0ABW6IAT5_9CYAN